jgi:hypothetical protein
MAESKAAWDKVGEDFRVLGRQIKQHYDQRPRPEGSGRRGPGNPEGVPRSDKEDLRGGAPGDRGTEVQEVQEGQEGQGAPASDRRRVDDALEKLRDSLEQAFSALGDAVRDPQVGEQTKKAAGSLSDALTATFAEAGERFKRR